MNLPLHFTKQEDDDTSTARTVPLRADIPLADTWDLTALYPDVAAWQADFDAVRTVYPQLVDFRGKLGQSASYLRNLRAAHQRGHAVRHDPR